MKTSLWMDLERPTYDGDGGERGLIRVARQLFNRRLSRLKMASSRERALTASGRQNDRVYEGRECTDWLETSRISMSFLLSSKSGLSEIVPSHPKAVATVALIWLGDGRILDHKQAAL